MKRVAVVFVLAVIAPSLILGGLALRSLRDQQFLLERQQSLLYQGVADGLAKTAAEIVSQQQRAFVEKVTELAVNHDADVLSKSFDDLLRKDWPMAQVGFVVTLEGAILSPAPASPETRTFLADNGRFLANQESVAIYANPKQLFSAFNNAQVPSSSFNAPEANLDPGRRDAQSRVQSKRNVIPQQQLALPQQSSQAEENQQNFSKAAAAPAEFRQLIGADTDGMLARFVDNKLDLIFWCRPPSTTKQSKSGAGEPQTGGQLVFGAMVALPQVIGALKPALEELPAALRGEICAAILDDNARPVALSHPGFRARNWKRPFVATEIADVLPHWEVGVYLLDPAKLARSAQAIKLTLGLLTLMLLLAIGVGSWLIVSDLNRQLTLARQKTDFVSNVSHELKTPLTSIRMFSELLADGRVADPAKQHSYLAIITSEAARLTRLINNVLDFARLERGEKKYRFQDCDLAAVVRETVESLRPHLEAGGFKVECRLPDAAAAVHGDRDALAQIIVNLISNAEKYSGERKEILICLEQKPTPLPHFELSVLDRGVGVPRGSEQRIFEKFYRAHDSLSSGIQGSGLGLTLARQIARAHGGEVEYRPRDSGGRCFTLNLPVKPGGEQTEGAPNSSPGVPTTS